jgi:hypothetical protein
MKGHNQSLIVWELPDHDTIFEISGFLLNFRIDKECKLTGMCIMNEAIELV